MTQSDNIHVYNSAKLKKYLSPDPDTTHWQLRYKMCILEPAGDSYCGRPCIHNYAVKPENC